MRSEYDFSKGKRGAVLPQKGKTRISIFIDNAVLDGFRSRAERVGTGYQTMMNEALRQYLSESDHPVTEKALRQILRQEMPEYLRGLTPRSTQPHGSGLRVNGNRFFGTASLASPAVKPVSAYRPRFHPRLAMWASDLEVSWLIKRRAAGYSLCN